MFDGLDPKLSFLCQAGDDVIRPCKNCGGCQIRVPRSIHSFIQHCPIQSRLQSALGVHSFYVKYNNTHTNNALCLSNLVDNKNVILVSSCLRGFKVKVKVFHFVRSSYTLPCAVKILMVLVLKLTK